MRVFGYDLRGLTEKHSRLQPRDAKKNVITRRLLHIAKPADMVLFAGPSYCAWNLSGLLFVSGADASFFRVPLLFLSHLQGGSFRRRGPLPPLSFVCVFVFTQQCCSSWLYICIWNNGPMLIFDHSDCTLYFAARFLWHRIHFMLIKFGCLSRIWWCLLISLVSFLSFLKQFKYLKIKSFCCTALSPLSNSLDASGA